MEDKQVPASEPKPGVKTTEFWVVLLAALIAVLSGLTVTDGTVNFAMNESVVQWFVLGAAGGYPVARGMAKRK